MNLCKQFANVIDVHSVYEGGVKINHLLSHGIFRKENIFWTTKIVILIALKLNDSTWFYGFLTPPLLCHKL